MIDLAGDRRFPAQPRQGRRGADPVFLAVGQAIIVVEFLEVLGGRLILLAHHRHARGRRFCCRNSRKGQKSMPLSCKYCQDEGRAQVKSLWESRTYIHISHCGCRPPMTAWPSPVRPARTTIRRNILAACRESMRLADSCPDCVTAMGGFLCGKVLQMVVTEQELLKIISEGVVAQAGNRLTPSEG